jgi:hypothetical protein
VNVILLCSSLEPRRPRVIHCFKVLLSGHFVVFDISEAAGSIPEGNAEIIAIMLYLNQNGDAPAVQPLRIAEMAEV